jgi:hypothetical protein
LNWLCKKSDWQKISMMHSQTDDRKIDRLIWFKNLIWAFKIEMSWLLYCLQDWKSGSNLIIHIDQSTDDEVTKILFDSLIPLLNIRDPLLVINFVQTLLSSQLRDVASGWSWPHGKKTVRVELSAERGLESLHLSLMTSGGADDLFVALDGSTSIRCALSEVLEQLPMNKSARSR